MSDVSNGNSSRFIIYGIGQVAKDKEPGSFIIEYFPIENMPSAGSDPLKKNSDPVSNVSSSGSNEVTSGSKGGTEKAEWLAINSGGNRLLPPDVVQGEFVVIYTYAGMTKRFWNTMYIDQDIRKKENAVFMFSNKTGAATGGLMEKSYNFTVNTYNKFIKLFTANNDGEKTTYEIKIDTKAGIVTFKDGNGNTYKLESEKGDVNVNINNEMIIEAGSNYKVKCPNIEFESSNFTVNSANINLIGTVNVK